MRNRKDFNKLGRTTLNTINIFTEFYLRNVREGNILPYDDDVISYLASHTSKDNKFGSYMMSDYLDAMNNSIQSIEESSLTYARLIALGLKKPYTIHTVRMDMAMFKNETNKRIDYSWVETEDGIYDPVFRGIWPKNLWEKSFHPNMKCVLDEKTEKQLLQQVKDNTIETPNKYNMPLLSTGTIPGFPKEFFGAEREDIEFYTFQHFMFKEWLTLREKKPSLPIEIPKELISRLVCDCICRDEYSPSDRSLACIHLLEFVASDFKGYLNNKSYIKEIYPGGAPIVYNPLLKSYLGSNNLDPIVVDVIASAMPQSIKTEKESKDKNNSLLYQ